MLGKYVFVVKHPGFFSYFPCVTRTPSLLTQYVCRACFRRAPCVLKDADLSQRKTGRPVLWLRAVRRLCVHQKTYVARTCIVLLCQILHADRTQTTRTPNVRVALNVKYHTSRHYIKSMIQKNVIRAIITVDQCVYLRNIFFYQQIYQVRSFSS